MERYFQWCCKIRDAAIRDGLHYYVYGVLLYAVIQIIDIRGLWDFTDNQYLILLFIIIIITQVVPCFIIFLGHLPVIMFYVVNIFCYLFRKGYRIRTKEQTTFRPDITLYREQNHKG